MILEPKLDINYECESKETSLSHSEQIKAKLQKWKSNNSKVVATNIIDHFLTKKIELINSNQNVHTEDIIENHISTSIEIINKIDDKQNKIIECKQESIKTGTNTVTLNDYSNNTNIELLEYSVDNSNNKNTKDNKDCLKIVAEKSNNQKDYKIDLISETNENENLIAKDIKLHPYSPKTKKDNNIEIDTSIAPKNRKCAIAETNIEDIKQRLKNLNCRMSEKRKIKTRFYATIDPNKNQQAENELSREISKDMFSRVCKSIITFLL